MSGRILLKGEKDGDNMCIEEKLAALVDKFNMKVDEDENLASYVKDMERKIQIEFTDTDECYWLELKNSKLSQLQKGRIDDADIVLTTDKETMKGLLNGTIKAMKAYATRKLKIKAALQDILLMKKLIK